MKKTWDNLVQTFDQLPAMLPYDRGHLLGALLASTILLLRGIRDLGKFAFNPVVRARLLNFYNTGKLSAEIAGAKPTDAEGPLSAVLKAGYRKSQPNPDPPSVGMFFNRVKGEIPFPPDRLEGLRRVLMSRYRHIGLKIFIEGESDIEDKSVAFMEKYERVKIFGLYEPSEIPGQAGQIYFKVNASRITVFEEIIHFLQDKQAGFPGRNTYNQIIIKEGEVEAINALLSRNHPLFGELRRELWTLGYRREIQDLKSKLTDDEKLSLGIARAKISEDY